MLCLEINSHESVHTYSVLTSGYIYAGPSGSAALLHSTHWGRASIILLSGNLCNGKANFGSGGGGEVKGIQVLTTRVRQERII